MGRRKRKSTVKRKRTRKGGAEKGGKEKALTVKNNAMIGQAMYCLKR